MPQLFGLARLGRDAELRYTPDNTPVASLSLAFNYGRRGEDGKRPTQWVDGALWGKPAESLCEYLVKGTAVAVTIDDVHIESFQRADGSSGHKLVGRVTAIELAGSPADRAAAPAPQRAAAPAPRTAARQAAKPATGFDDMDDDIPFE